jgi:hypothetical protein
MLSLSLARQLLLLLANGAFKNDNGDFPDSGALPVSLGVKNVDAINGQWVSS